MYKVRLTSDAVFGPTLDIVESVGPDCPVGSVSAKSNIELSSTVSRMAYAV